MRNPVSAAKFLLWWSERMSERTLWITALARGFPGIVAGGLLFHHKTSKGEFWLLVAISTFLWLPSWPLYEYYELVTFSLPRVKSTTRRK